ncbi:high mobility group [Artemisia annua]|uniref:High mobility group n=1 Tax=Artemisia annua TaxID=35608 RepID=A0A2U1Q3E1_ARTAN|nr:high mobility group [Artemisia annua]
MFKFLKEVVSGSGAGVKDLPYSIGSRDYDSACQSGHKIDLGLHIMYIVSTVIFALNLVAVIALTVVGIIKIRRALHILLVLCWLIIVFCWLFFLSREGFRKQFKEENPTNNSVAAVGKAGGAKWKAMSDAEKAPFVAKAEQRKKDYDKTLAAYNKKKDAVTEEENDSDKSKSEVNDNEEDGSDEVCL